MAKLRAETGDSAHRAATQPDPLRTQLADLLVKDHVENSLRLLRESRRAFAGLFAYTDDNGFAPLWEPADPSPLPYPRDDVYAILAGVKAASKESEWNWERHAVTKGGLLVVAHPIHLYCRQGGTVDTYLKGCLVLVQSGLDDLDAARKTAKLVADLYSERVSMAFESLVHYARRREAESELRLGRDEIVSLIDTLGATLVLVDRNYRIVWHKGGLDDARGPDVDGRLCYEVACGRTEPCEQCLVRQTLETQEPQFGSIAMASPGEHTRYYSVTTAPVFGDDGAVEQVLELLVNITDHHSAEARLAQYRKLIDSSDNLMVIGDTGGMMLAVNQRLLSELGYSEDELVGRNGSCLLAEHEFGKALQISDNARAAGRSFETIHLKRKDGSIVPTEAFATFDKDYGVFEVIFRSTEERLRMEDEIRKRSEQLAAQNKQVRAAMQDRERLFRHVSHELRTPLTSIIGFSELLLEDTQQPLTQSQCLAMQRISGNAHKLLGLVNDLLELSRLDARRAAPEPASVQLGELLKQVADSMLPLATEKGLRLLLDVPADMPVLYTDERKLGQIMVNLISNAIKFTDAGSVTVSVSVKAKSVNIAVRDTGVGISEKDLPRVFDEFYRASRHSHRRQGTGLGLTIAQRLAAVLGGRITVESQPCKGATFTVKLPLAGPTRAK